MGVNTLAGTGLVYSRNLIAASPTYQANVYTIKKGYATAIGIGDVVSTGTSGNLGYVTLSADSASSILGVFAGVGGSGLGAGYYDLSTQQQQYGLNGSWPTTANPQNDVSVLVVDSQTIVFRAQVSGGPWLQSWRGKNIDWLHGGGTGGNGAPNASGISTLVLDGASIQTTNTLPFRIVDVVGVAGGPQDPNNTNPWIEVQFNPAVVENLQSLGI